MRQWVLLAYRLPREPSTPRIAVWRHLRRLGVAQISDGLAALPLDARTREHLEWLAADVREHSGEAMIWVGQPGTAAEERLLIQRMKTATHTEYSAITNEARALLAEPASRKRQLGRLRRELRSVGLRDYFPGPERSRAEVAVESVRRRLEAAS